MRLAILGAALSMLAFASQGAACTSDTPCMVGDRAYYVATPDKPKAAVVYVHGWGGSGKGALRHKQLTSVFLERGYAVIAPDGVPREGRSGRSWRFHPRSGGQMEEITFLQAVRDDAAQRLDLDPENILLAGFSIGGSMVAYTACLAPEAFPAYAPIGGNFWRPHPTDCAGAVNMLHTHGWSDGTVPLEGRVVNGVPPDDPSAFTQGDIFHAMSIWRETNGCPHLKADRFVMDEAFWRRIWTRCSSDAKLELAVYPDGHTIPDTWPDLIMDWFENLKKQRLPHRDKS